MKAVFALLSLLAITTVLNGCAVYTPSGSVVLDPAGGSGGGSHCPPGQAKKGNC